MRPALFVLQNRVDAALSAPTIGAGGCLVLLCFSCCPLPRGMLIFHYYSLSFIHHNFGLIAVHAVLMVETVNHYRKVMSAPRIDGATRSFHEPGF
jgi:hypothetical protein